MSEINDRIMRWIVRVRDYGQGNPDPDFDGLTIGDLAQRIRDDVMAGMAVDQCQWQGHSWSVICDGVGTPQQILCANCSTPVTAGPMPAPAPQPPAPDPNTPVAPTPAPSPSQEDPS